jgi:ferric-dicitrate binding protein FerR (iron transport regulator)
MNRTMAIMAVAALLAMNLGAQGRDEDEEARRGSENRGPTLGVARISVTDGDVRLIRASRDAVQAKAGMPLVLGDRFATGSRSRAEIQFDGGNFARLGADTEVRIGELGNKRFEIEVLSGLVSFSQFVGFEADVDVETSLATVRPIKPSVFVVEHQGEGQTDVTVRDGVVEVFTDNEIEKVKGGLLSVRGDPAELRMAKAEPKSSFDDWAKRRDKLLERDGRSTWQRWVPDYLGFGYGYPWGWGYGYGPGFGPRFGTAVFYRGGPRWDHRGGFRGGRR